MKSQSCEGERVKQRDDSVWLSTLCWSRRQEERVSETYSVKEREVIVLLPGGVF